MWHSGILTEIQLVRNSSPDSAIFVPPMREGVGASRVQVTSGDWPSVLDFLCEKFPAVGEAVWQSRFRRGLVLDAEGKPLAATSLCVTGARIFYYRELESESEIPFYEQIIFQDENILVVDKPHFLPVIPSGRYVRQSLLVRLKNSTGISSLSPIHRIDKDTAGLVLFSVNPATRDAYQALFRSRAVKKIYHAVAPLTEQYAWPLRYCSRLVEDEQFFRTCEVTGETNSETIIALIQAWRDKGLYELQPVTGKKHQLRVHLASLGIPIMNDPLYPAVKAGENADFSAPLQLLAKSLAFTDPLSGLEQKFTSSQHLQLIS